MPITRNPLSIPLWPNGAPGIEDWDWGEAVSHLPSGDRVVRNVVQPSLTAYLPASPNGTAVIVCPGGAFHFLSIDFEGTDVAVWLAERGVTAFVLRYRLIRTDADFMTAVAANLRNIQDFQSLVAPLYPLLSADINRAIEIVRTRADEWRINSNRIGTLGFSAGAVVTVLAALLPDQASRPNFIAPIYCGPLPPLNLPADAPPLFTLCACDDAMAVTNTLTLFEAYRAAHLPVELHIYSRGGHGFGMKSNGMPTDGWIERLYDWMNQIR